MKTTSRQKLATAVLVGTLGLTAPLLAQDTPVAGDKSAEAKPAGELQPAAEPAPDPWHFTLAPLLWASAVDGNVTVRGHKANVDTSFSDVVNHLDGALMLYLELRKKKFGFYAQPNYMKLSADGDAGPLSANDTMKIWIVEAGGFYQIGEWGQEKPLTLDATIGVQYLSLHNELTLKGAGGVINFKGSDTMDLIDPMIGLRVRKYLTTKLSLNIQGNVGGFDVSDHSSDLSWQAVGMLGYDFTKHFSLYAGYRALSVRKDSGQKGVDLLLNGMLLGLQFHW
jgi:hypothetical protein